MDLSRFAAGLIYMPIIIIVFINRHRLEPFVMPPFSSDRLPVFVNRLVDMLLIYPLFLVAAISSIGYAAVLTGIIPEDPQKLAVIHITFTGFILRCAAIPFIALIEELFNLTLVLTIYKHLHLPKNLRFIISVIAASMAFGLLHVFSWGTAASAALSMTFVPVIAVTLYSGKIWTSVFAHMYLDLLTSARLYSLEAYGFILAVLALAALVLTAGKAFTKV